MYSLLCTIQQYHSNLENLTVEDTQEWDTLRSLFLFNDTRRHLPVPVFSFIRPTMGHRFILHILLSLGHYATEFDLILHRNLRESFRYAKLIGPNNDPESLERYSNNVMNLWINEQLAYFPNSTKILDQWIIEAGEIFDAIIIRDELPITDMPPVIQTSLNKRNDDDIVNRLTSTKTKIISAIMREIEPLVTLMNIPTVEEFQNFTKESQSMWDPIGSFCQSTTQSNESYAEQKIVLHSVFTAICDYTDPQRHHLFTKCRVIYGSPGCGKSF